MLTVRSCTQSVASITSEVENSTYRFTAQDLQFSIMNFLSFMQRAISTPRQNIISCFHKSSQNVVFAICKPDEVSHLTEAKEKNFSLDKDLNGLAEHQSFNVLIAI